jgi:hypothetical protein
LFVCAPHSRVRGGIVTCRQRLHGMPNFHLRKAARAEPAEFLQSRPEKWPVVSSCWLMEKAAM